MQKIEDKFNHYAFGCLFYSNGLTGFENIALFSNSEKKQTESKKTAFVFINYDYKNNIENLKSKGNITLFPEQIYFDADEEILFENLNEIFLEKKITPFRLKIIQNVSKQQYIENVKQIKHHIQQGDIYELNYCISFDASDAEINPIDVYYRLNQISKVPYSALVKLNNQYIISSSPELYLRKRYNRLFTKPIKGTAKRSSNKIEDEQIKKDLQESLKERCENVMVVDVARNDLSRVAKKGSVRVDKLYDIESYEQVHQMVSTVSCEVKDNTSFMDIIKATFPMASMTGAPKIRAMELIEQYEYKNRDAFSGCIGYKKPNGDFDLNVLIRSIFYDAEKKHLSFSVGSAITHLCDPEKEYEECMIKAKALIEVLTT